MSELQTLLRDLRPHAEMGSAREMDRMEETAATVSPLAVPLTPLTPALPHTAPLQPTAPPATGASAFDGAAHAPPPHPAAGAGARQSPQRSPVSPLLGVPEKRTLPQGFALDTSAASGGSRQRLPPLPGTRVIIAAEVPDRSRPPALSAPPSPPPLRDGTAQPPQAAPAAAAEQSSAEPADATPALQTAPRATSAGRELAS
eukprot:gene34348-11675_t